MEVALWLPAATALAGALIGGGTALAAGFAQKSALHEEARRDREYTVVARAYDSLSQWCEELRYAIRAEYLDDPDEALPWDRIRPMTFVRIPPSKHLYSDETRALVEKCQLSYHKMHFMIFGTRKQMKTTAHQVMGEAVAVQNQMRSEQIAPLTPKSSLMQRFRRRR